MAINAYYRLLRTSIKGYLDKIAQVRQTSVNDSLKFVRRRSKIAQVRQTSVKDSLSLLNTKVKTRAPEVRLTCRLVHSAYFSKTKLSKILSRHDSIKKVQRILNNMSVPTPDLKILNFSKFKN